MLSTADIYRWLDGSEFMGERLVVQFARGNQPRPRDGYHDAPRMAPRPRRTVHRMTITGLPFETSWQVSIFSFRGTQLLWIVIPSTFTSPAPCSVSGVSSSYKQKHLLSKIRGLCPTHMSSISALH